MVLIPPAHRKQKEGIEMKKINWMLLIGFCAVLLSAGCTAAQPVPPTATPPAAISLVDGLGNKVDLTGPAKRIISLGPSNTEILYALGAQSRIVGCDQHSDYPAEAKPLATIADYPVLNIESIVALQPDLVLASELFPAEQIQTLRELGLQVYWLANPKTFPDGLYENLRIVGLLTGTSPAAEQVVSGLQQRVESVRRAAAAAKSSPLVFYELDGTEPAHPWTVGTGSGGFVDSLIRLAGGRNMGASLPTAWAQVSIEEILRQDPDIILLGDAVGGMTPKSVSARPGWGDLRAVKSGAIFPINGDLTTRPGPRLVEGLETIFRLIHPEIE
jgi:iron complex transport system substrate-binding protein